LHAFRVTNVLITRNGLNGIRIRGIQAFQAFEAEIEKQDAINGFNCVYIFGNGSNSSWE